MSKSKRAQTKKPYIEGYWRWTQDQTNSLYPFPEQQFESINSVFIDKVDAIMHAINNNTLPQGSYVQTLGYAKCRLCGCANGSYEYTFEYKGIKYVFPNGLLHYFREHKVHPTQPFYDAVMNISW